MRGDAFAGPRVLSPGRGSRTEESSRKPAASRRVFHPADCFLSQADSCLRGGLFVSLANSIYLKKEWGEEFVGSAEAIADPFWAADPWSGTNPRTKGLISADRRTKPTLMLTIPRS